jgi:hypothetical protein
MLDNGVEHAQCGSSEQLQACLWLTYTAQFAVQREAQERRAVSHAVQNMTSRTEEAVLARSLLLSEFTFQSGNMLLSQVIRISPLSRKLIITQRMYRNSECVFVVSVVRYLEVFLLLLRGLFT